MKKTEPAGGCLGFVFAICVVLYVVFGMLWMFIKEHIGMICIIALIIGAIWYMNRSKKSKNPTLLEAASQNRERFYHAVDGIYIDLNSVDIDKSNRSGRFLGYQRAIDKDNDDVYTRAYILLFVVRANEDGTKTLIISKFFSLAKLEGTYNIVTVESAMMYGEISVHPNRREYVENPDEAKILTIESTDPKYTEFFNRMTKVLKDPRYKDQQYNEKKYNYYRDKFYNEYY